MYYLFQYIYIYIYIIIHIMYNQLTNKLMIIMWTIVIYINILYLSYNSFIIIIIISSVGSALDLLFLHLSSICLSLFHFENEMISLRAIFNNNSYSKLTSYYHRVNGGHLIQWETHTRVTHTR